MKFETYDVVLQSTGRFQSELSVFQTSPPIQADFHIDQNMWIGRLPYALSSSTVMDACDSTGYNYRPARQNGCRYAFVRKIDSDEYPSYQWDEDGHLGKVLFLSRLIHPTTVAGQYSARLIFESGKLKTIIPGHTSGFGTQVWIVADDWRDWLTTAEAEKLRDLLPIYLTTPPVDRVRRARARIDYAFHSYYLDQRVTSLVTGFESLLKVGERSATAQSRIRVPRLAELFGITITDDDARAIYGDRSDIVHGEGPRWKDVDEKLMTLYQKFEQLLRATLLKASINKTFSQNFASNQAIRNAFGNLAKTTIWPCAPLLPD
ncbi:MAG TPA: hypothetical protein VNY78_05245 [Edaphobacter sp.]|jgi:hypothetical protein|nr:hypothetical protein [Edaphobacter sp.]